MPSVEQTRPATTRPAATRAPAAATATGDSDQDLIGNAAVQEQMTGANPTVGAGLEHAPVDPTDAVNAPDTTTAPTSAEADMWVRILHDITNPLEVAETPPESSLYEEVAVEPDTTPAGQQVTSTSGDLANPASLTVLPDESTLYIDGAPSIQDIHQAGLADCYFLASIGAIVQSDASKIQSVVTGTGATVSVTLHRYDASQSPAWIPATVSVDNELLQRTDRSGTVAAGVRAASTPKLARWWVELEGQTLSYHVEYVYEMAMWAPLLEKGYASFAAQYGQYGGFATASANAQNDSEGNARSGYDLLNGGIAQFSYPLMYGPDCVSFNQTNMSFTAGENNVSANIPAIRNLLRVMGEGVPEGQAFNMTVGMGRNTAVERLYEQAVHTMGEMSAWRHLSLYVDLALLRRRITTWRAATGDAKTTALQEVAEKAQAIVRPGAYDDELHSVGAEDIFSDLNELGNVVANIATDSSPGQRFTYAWHSYTVMGASFVDNDGAAMSLDQSNVAAQAANIDDGASTVRLRNPHGTNEPNEHGSGPTSGADMGEFSLTLDQFFRAFQFQQHGFVRT